jgi:peptide/nickel transport system permease protein
MGRFLVRRLAYTALTILLASIALFLLFEIDPETVAVHALGQYSTSEQRTLWLQQNDYFAPAYVRYVAWLRRLVSGDLGHSRVFNVPVADVLWTRAANSLLLTAAFFLIMIPLSLSVGIVGGMCEGSLIDRLLTTLCIVTTSIPPFASAVLVSAVFVFGLGWLPGTSAMIDGFSVRELVLPVLVLVLSDFGYVARITRACMVDVMATPYIRAAVLKGLPHRRVILRHALRNALIAPFTVIMLHVNWVIGGVVVVEFFFAYKGVGSLVLEAALVQDIFLAQGCTMLMVILAVGTQTLADVGYTYLNPRIRFR